MEEASANRVLQRNIDVIVALIGVAIGIGISCLNFIYSNEYLITMGPMLTIVCLVYIVVRRRLLTEPEVLPNASTSLILTINIIFWASFAGSIYCLSTDVIHRPLAYFLLTSLSASMIAVQILYYRGKATVYLVLFEILILSLSIRASAFWVFPTIPGIDAWAHIAIVKEYVTQGHIVESLSPWGSVNHYYSMPLMHLSVAGMQIVTGVNYKAAMFLGCSLPLMLSTVFVFLIGQRLVSVKVGLLAMLLLNLSDWHIRWGAGNIIAMSFGIALFTVILYLLTRDRSEAGVCTASLTILFLMMLVLTHTVSSFIMFCFLLMVVIGSYIYKFMYHDRDQLGRSIVAPTLAGLFTTVMLVHWMYVYMIRGGLSFMQSMSRGFYVSITEKAEFLVTRAPAATTEWGWLGPILDISGYLLFILWGIIGCLLWLSRKHQTKTKVGLIAALIIMIGLPFSFPLFGIANIQPDRWFAFYYVILSIPAVTGMLAIINRIGYQKLRSVVLICLIFSFSFLMITNSISNMDSPVYAPYLNERLVYTKSEMAAARIVEAYDGKVVADRRYNNVLIASGYKETKDVSQRMLDERHLNSSMVIWRDILSERPAVITTTTRSQHATVLGEAYEQKLENSHNLIYSNKDVKVFLARDLE